MVQTRQGRIGGPPSGGRDAPGLAFPGIKSAGGNVKDVPTMPGRSATTALTMKEAISGPGPRPWGLSCNEVLLDVIWTKVVSEQKGMTF